MRYSYFTVYLASLLLALCFQSVDCKAANNNINNSSLVIIQGQSPINVAPFVELLEDTSGNLSITQLTDPTFLARSPAKFKKSTRDNLSLGYSSSTWWFKLQTKATFDDQWIFFIDYTMLDKIDVYQVVGNGEPTIVWRGGDLLPFNLRPIKANGFIIPVELAIDQDVTFYFRVSTQGALMVPLTLYTVADFIQWNDLERLLLGIMAGGVLFMLLYNLIIWITIREQAYLVYSLYLVSVMWALFQINGIGFQYLWPESAYLQNHGYSIVYNTTFMFALFFSESLLSVNESHPRLSKIIKIEIVIIFIHSITSPFMPRAESLLLSMVWIPITVITILTISVIRVRDGFEPAKYYLLAWLAPLASLCIFAMGAAGWIEEGIWTRWAPPIGVSIEVVLLSLALANRIQLLRQAKIESDIQREAAHSANEAKGAFLANMSHEIRTPMNGVVGVAELLAETPLNSHQTRLLETIQSSGKGLIEIVNQILDLSKIEADKFELENIDFNLEDVLRETTAIFQARTFEHGVKFYVDLDLNLPQIIKGDPTRLRQVLINLVSNAFKFTEFGSVTIKLSRTDDTILFEVIDTGRGMSEASCQKIFKRYTQEDSSIQRNYGGTGLGLVISKNIVELTGGEIGVNSIVDVGTTFWFTLPLQTSVTDCTISKQLGVAPHRESLYQTLIITCEDKHIETQLRDYAEHFGLDTIIGINYPAIMQCSRALVALDTLGAFSTLCQILERPDNNSGSSTARWHHPDILAVGHSTLFDSLKSKKEAATHSILPVIGLHCITTPLFPSDIAKTLSQTPKTDSPPTTQQEIHALNFKRVLVAEDNAVNQLVISGMLKSLKVPIDIVNNGAEVLAKLDKQEYDLILMDCEMPEMDGFEATAIIRDRADAIGEIPIIALTAHGFAEYKERVFELGMNAHLTKPIQKDTLARVLQPFER